MLSIDVKNQWNSFLDVCLPTGLYKKRLSPCRKKSEGADDYEDCQTGMSRSRSRAGAGQEQARNKARAGQKHEQGRAGQGQGRSRAEQSKAEQGRKRAGAGEELGNCRIGA